MDRGIEREGERFAIPCRFVGQLFSSEMLLSLLGDLKPQRAALFIPLEVHFLR